MNGDEMGCLQSYYEHAELIDRILDMISLEGDHTLVISPSVIDEISKLKQDVKNKHDNILPRIIQ